MITKIAKGDSFSVGPFSAKLADGSTILLAGLKAWASCKLVTALPTDLPVFTKKNFAGGGVDTQVATNSADGSLQVNVDSADTLLLTSGGTYGMDLRVKTTDGKVYLLGAVVFQVVDAVTAVPI